MHVLNIFTVVLLYIRIRIHQTNCRVSVDKVFNFDCIISVKCKTQSNWSYKFSKNMKRSAISYLDKAYEK